MKIILGLLAVSTLARGFAIDFDAARNGVPIKRTEFALDASSGESSVDASIATAAAPEASAVAPPPP